MQVIEFRKFGGPDQLQLTERPTPKADGSNAVVRIEAASVNPSDVKNVAGRMSQTTLPRVPGRDYSGVVVDGPKNWVGKNVWGTGGDVGFTRDGTHAEYIVVPADSLVVRPESLSHEQAAAIGVTFLTAWCGLVEYAQLQKRETLAIFGSSGGVGGAAVQIAKRIGARVIGIDRSVPAPDAPVSRLADVLLDAKDADLPKALRSSNGGRGADVVLNAAGGPSFEMGLTVLAHRGRQIEITAPSQRRATFDLVDFYHNESRLFGLDTLKRDLVASARVLEQIKNGFDDGSFQAPVISQILPLYRAQYAYELVDRGERGRVVLKAHLN
jgi:NADPH2:quinone reductase